MALICFGTLLVISLILGCASTEQSAEIYQEDSGITQSSETVFNRSTQVESTEVAAAPIDTLPINVPHPEDVLPLPWADFNEMHAPGGDYNGMGITGRLEIEDRCVYLDFRASYDTYTQEPQRLVLSLPRDRIQYDPASGELWVHYSGGKLEGPIVSGQRVGTGGSYGGRSQLCDNEVLATVSGLRGCRRVPTVNHPLCEIEEYARLHRIQRDEAQRRFVLFPTLLGAIEELREIEAVRTAGWGFEHKPEFLAWFRLTDNDPPSETSRTLTDKYEELEIRTGATFSYKQLLEAQRLFADGHDLCLPQDTNDKELHCFELASAVAQTWIDHGKNELVVAVDFDRLPRRIASSVLAAEAEHDGYLDAGAILSHISTDELLAAVGHIIEQQLDVPLRVVRGVKFP